jgi:hypothetical protein
VQQDRPCAKARAKPVAHGEHRYGTSFALIDQYRQLDTGDADDRPSPKGGSMMKMSHETDRIPEPYTPTPDGFERRLRA